MDLLGKANGILMETIGISVMVSIGLPFVFSFLAGMSIIWESIFKNGVWKYLCNPAI